jgi:hypothetical protein
VVLKWENDGDEVGGTSSPESLSLETAQKYVLISVQIVFTGM